MLLPDLLMRLVWTSRSTFAHRTLFCKYRRIDGECGGVSIVVVQL